MTLTKRPLFYWILRKYRSLQLFLIALIVLSLFFKVYPLEMQRKIINVAINLKELDLLYLYCGLYMGAVLTANLMKYVINVLQAVIGQKILIDMRKELYGHILQLPLQFFHRTQAGIIISAMTAELNAVGSFLGGAIAIPIASILTFITFLGFMIYLNPLLGLLSMGIYPFEILVIPMLQKRYNKQNKQRVQTTRSMANLVNESVSGIHEVQGNTSHRLEQKKLNTFIHRLYAINKKLFIYKYGIKSSNNLFQSIGPFILFLVGGYLAIHGNFTIGALVAFLSAYEKVYDPWKEIIEYYQLYQDAKVRYKQIMQTFDLQPEYLLETPPEQPPIQLKGKIEAKNIGYSLSEDIVLVDDVTFTLQPGQHMALIGFSGSGKSTLSLLISQLYKYSEGSLQIDGQEIAHISKTDISKNISTVAQHPFIFTGTVKENLLYSCQALYLSGSCETLPERDELLNIIKEMGLEADVFRWGFRTIIPRDKAISLSANFLNMRTIIHDQLQEDFQRAVEFYDVHAFLEYSSLAVNIIFGGYYDRPEPTYILQNPTLFSFIQRSNLEETLIDLGIQLASSSLDLLKGLKGDDFFFQGSPMESHEYNMFSSMMETRQPLSSKNFSKKDKQKFLELSLRFIPGQHKIITLSEEIKTKILAARHSFLKDVANIDLELCESGNLQTSIFSTTSPQQMDENYFPYCVSQYLFTQSLADNILFGNVIDRDMMREKLRELVEKRFFQSELLDSVLDIGLDFHVGSKGDKLSGGQKQKIALARALLKKSPILILDEATASLDNTSQTKIQRYLENNLKGNTTVVAVMHRLDMISGYDHIVVMKAGKIVESGAYQDLMKAKGTFYELANDA